jgi:hypothetical protein
MLAKSVECRNEKKRDGNVCNQAGAEKGVYLMNQLRVWNSIPPQPEASVPARPQKKLVWGYRHLIQRARKHPQKT